MDPSDTVGYDPLDPRSSPRRFARYELRREIGRGAMAEVHEAWDPDLRRRVAVKILHPGRGEGVRTLRLRREAILAAGLSHPNIVTVHEVGEADDDGRKVPYLVMEYVEGATFEAILEAGAIDLPERVRIVTEVAAAVGHAHARGVLHRDLKPANVLIDRSGRVVLTDFGMATGDGGGTRITQTHAVFGTPLYMAPEQVEGRAREIDARTDVWALGAILYEALAGRPAFDGRTAAAIFEAIRAVDPAPLDRRVPPELEAIARKCLARDPAGRYAAAGAVALELARYGRGEPVEARPTSRVGRAARKVGRRWRALAAGGAVLAVGAVGGLAFERSRGTVPEGPATEVGGDGDAYREYALGQLDKRTATALAAAIELRRKGDLPAMERFAREVDDACAEAGRVLPDAAEPHLHRGRMLRATLDVESALAEQDRALEKDPDLAAALYERVVLLASLFHARWLVVSESVWKGSGPPDLDRIEERIATDPDAAELRRRLRTDLARLEGLAAARPELLDAGRLACARGLSDWIGGRPDDAWRSLTEALDLDADLEEARLALGHLAERLGRLDEALAVWSAGLDRDRGFVPFHVGRARTRAVLGLAAWSARSDPTGHLGEALADLDRAVELDPGRGEVRAMRGHVQVYLAVATSATARDAGPLFAAAVADYTAALEGCPERDRYRQWRAEALVSQGLYASERGLDPGPYHTRALQDLGLVLERHPDWGEAWTTRGTARNNWSLTPGPGVDRIELLEQAIADLTRALDLDRTRLEAYLTRAQARSNLGIYRHMAGIDDRASFEGAADDLSEVLVAGGERPDLLGDRATIYVQLARLARQRGEDPSPSIAAAAADFERALTLAPERIETWIERADALAGWGLASIDLGLEPDEFLRRAAADYDRAAALAPRLVEPRLSAARARMTWAGQLLARGEHPNALLARAVAGLEESLALVLALEAPPPGVEEEIRDRLATCREILDEEE